MADQYASIIIDISHEDVDRVFQYRIPPALLPEIRVGVQVCVPFGSGNRTRNGYVVELTDRPDYDKEKIKEIISVTEKSITADTRLIELALVDERAIWLYHESGVKDGTSGEEKGEGTE